MSEYQYYEFLALDRPLSATDMEALRALSTRARITKTSFTNHYEWGSFKGDPRQLVERHFDLFLYLSNWGTRELMLRLPRRALDLAAARAYAVDGALSIETTGKHVIVSIGRDGEAPDDWDDGHGHAGALAPLRADLMRGDFRCLYIAWLAGLDAGGTEDDEAEPPPPPGLTDLTAPLEALADFLLVDDDLLTAAAEGAPAAIPRSESDLADAVRALAEPDKDALLLRLANDDPTVGPELGRRLDAEIRRRTVTSSHASPRLRTAGALRAAAAARAEAREREAADRAAAERARQAREEAARRARYLDELATRQDAAWHKVASLLATRRPDDYDRAVALLVDLRDVSEQLSQRAAYDRRLADQLAPHARKSTLAQRLRAAGLV